MWTIKETKLKMVNTRERCLFFNLNAGKPFLKSAFTRDLLIDELEVQIKRNKITMIERCYGKNIQQPVVFLNNKKNILLTLYPFDQILKICIELEVLRKLSIKKQSLTKR